MVDSIFRCIRSGNPFFIPKYPLCVRGESKGFSWSRFNLRSTSGLIFFSAFSRCLFKCREGRREEGGRTGWELTHLVVLARGKSKLGLVEGGHTHTHIPRPHIQVHTSNKQTPMQTHIDLPPRDAQSLYTPAQTKPNYSFIQRRLTQVAEILSHWSSPRSI